MSSSSFFANPGGTGLGPLSAGFAFGSGFSFIFGSAFIAGFAAIAVFSSVLAAALASALFSLFAAIAFSARVGSSFLAIDFSSGVGVDVAASFLSNIDVRGAELAGASSFFANDIVDDPLLSAFLANDGVIDPLLSAPIAGFCMKLLFSALAIPCTFLIADSYNLLLNSVPLIFLSL